MLIDYLSRHIDLGLIIAFLLLNLILGLRLSRSVTDLRDYALGGKNFSTAALVATIVATWTFGGSPLLDCENIYIHGMYYILARLGQPIGMMITGLLATRMTEFLNYTSVAEAMGGMYGKKVRIISALSGIFGRVGLTVLQFKVMSKMLPIFLGVESATTTFLAASVVIAYSVLGGIRAVTLTDVFQFFACGTILPILTLAIWNNLQDPTHVVITLTTHPAFDVRELLSFNFEFTPMLGLFFYYAIPGLYAPEIFQRIAMARDDRQIRQAFAYSAACFLLVLLLIAWVSVLLLTDRPGLARGQVISYMVSHHTYVGLKGLLGVGVMAVAMSTADSCLNTCAVLFANDIVGPLVSPSHPSLSTAKVFSCVMGFTALLISFLGDQDSIKLLVVSSSLYVTVYAVPMIMAILGFRSTTRAVLISMAAGLITVVLWSYYFGIANSIVPGILANIVGFVGSHYLLEEPGGWVSIRDKQTIRIAQKARQEAWQAFFATLRKPHLYFYLKKNLPTQEKAYVLLGLYVLGATYFSFFVLPETVVGTYPILYTFLNYSVSIAAMVFLTYPAWPMALKKQYIMAFVWPISLGYLLFSVGTILILLSGFHPVQIMVFMFSLIMAALLISWSLLLILTLTSIAVGISTFYLCAGVIPLPYSASELLLRLAYFLPLLSSFFIAFYVLLKHKKAYMQLATTHNTLLTDVKCLNIDHEETSNQLLAASVSKNSLFKSLRQIERESFMQIAKLSHQLEKEVSLLDRTGIIATKAKALREELAPITTALRRLDHRTADYLALQVSAMSIDNLLQSVQHILQVRGMDHDVRFEKMSRQEHLQCDRVKIMMVLVGSVPLLRTIQGKEATVRIGVEDTHLYYLLDDKKRDHVQQLPALRFTITTGESPPCLEQFYTVCMDERSLPVIDTVQDLPIVRNKRIIDAHYGYSDTLIEDHVCSLQYVIPVTLEDVRPQDIEQKEIDWAMKVLRAEKTHPGAEEREQAFLLAVSKRTKANMSRIRQAVEAVKTYHGLAKHPSGEPLWLHVLTVGHIVLNYNTEEATILGALFHEAVEGSRLLLEHIEIHYDKEVCQMVEGLKELEGNRDRFYTMRFSAAENIQRFLEVADHRILYVKIADRIHDMRTVRTFPYEHQLRLAEETLLFLVPLCKELGLETAAEELSDLSVSVLSRKKAH